MSIPTSFRQYQLQVGGSLTEQSLQLVQKELPALQPGQVLIKVHAVSLNYRDLLIPTGKYFVTVTDGTVPCSDMAGTVVAAGDGELNIKPGTRVVIDVTLGYVHDVEDFPFFSKYNVGGNQPGVLAEYVIVPVQAVVEIPDYLSFEEAATLPCAGLTAYNALFGGNPLKGGESVLVQGTGGTSILALQMAAASGASVIVTSSSDEKLQVAKELGAQHTINYRKTPNWDEEVLKITNNRGVDHVIEVGGAGTLVKSIRSTRYGGQVHSIGFLDQTTNEASDLQQLPFAILTRGAILRGVGIGSIHQHKHMNRLLAVSNIHPKISKVFPFEEAYAAYQYLQAQSHIGKVVIKVA